MAITSLDGILAGAQPPVDFYKVGTAAVAAGVLYTPIYATGYPGAAASPNAGSLNGTTLVTLSGSLPFTNPTSGNTYLSRFAGAATTAGSLFLVDRLWHNGTVSATTTTAQAITFSGLPARDANGSTNGVNVFVGLEIYGTTGNGAVTNTTMSYTNSAGTSGQTATIASVTAAATTGSFFPFQLAAGDVGVRSVQSLTLGTTYVSGTLGLVCYRILARIDLNQANSGWAIDPLTGGFPQLYNNTVPYLLWLPTVTTATNFWGSMSVSQG